MKIDPHDIQIRLNQARKFLMDGHKVQIVQNFRGREMIHRHRGHDRMREIIEQLSDISKVEMPPRQTGRRMTMMLSPDKVKIEKAKQREASKMRDAEVKSPPDTPPVKEAPETDAEGKPGMAAPTVDSPQTEPASIEAPNV